MFILTIFLASNQQDFILLPLKCPSSINFFLNMLGTGLLYLLDIVVNSSFMSVHRLVCLILQLNNSYLIILIILLLLSPI